MTKIGWIKVENWVKKKPLFSSTKKKTQNNSLPKRYRVKFNRIIQQSCLFASRGQVSKWNYRIWLLEITHNREIFKVNRRYKRELIQCKTISGAAWKAAAVPRNQTELWLKWKVISNNGNCFFFIFWNKSNISSRNGWPIPNEWMSESERKRPETGWLWFGVLAISPIQNCIFNKWSFRSGLAIKFNGQLKCVDTFKR